MAVLVPMSRAESHSTPHVLLLTGVPGVGKTTVMRRVTEALGERRSAGFLTDEIRERGERRGFRLVTLDGHEWIIAHVELPKQAHVGKYGVDIAALDAATAAALALRPDRDVYLVDEIGKMECLSPRFISAMRDLLGSGRVVIATIARHGEGFIRAVKARPDCMLWEVTRENRDRFPAEILAWLTERTSRSHDNGP
ncbi:MAG: AAA family ATPase [Betaproteobacteria bacterium]|nr:AAA family ATPase [Betaproteobacteria bacterium]